MGAKARGTCRDRRFWKPARRAADTLPRHRGAVQRLTCCSPLAPGPPLGASAAPSGSRSDHPGGAGSRQPRSRSWRPARLSRGLTWHRPRRRDSQGTGGQALAPGSARCRLPAPARSLPSGRAVNEPVLWPVAGLRAASVCSSVSWGHRCCLQGVRDRRSSAHGARPGAQSPAPSPCSVLSHPVGGDSASQLPVVSVCLSAPHPRVFSRWFLEGRGEGETERHHVRETP